MVWKDIASSSPLLAQLRPPLPGWHLACAKCCFWCGLGKMATRWQRHRPSQRWLLRRWLRWLCGGGCGSWWLRWWLRRGWLRRWLRWWPRLADAPPPRQGRHLVVTTGCKWSGRERLSVAVGKRGGEGSRHSPPARGEVYWHGSGRRPAPAVPVHGHRGTGGAAVHHGAGLRPAPAVPVQASGLLLHAGARCAPAPCVLWRVALLSCGYLSATLTVHLSL